MGVNISIEVDERTASLLQSRADELGMTVAQLVAELAALDTARVSSEDEAIAELDRRWQKTEAGRHTIAHERVVGWLRTWGTPGFRPWPNR